MKIVMFSINPIFPYVVTGGASKHLYHIATHLGAAGHQVEILCAQPDEELSPFYWAENVQVFPTLPFKMPFPQPYAISGADLALIVDRLSKALEDADRLYIHDGEWLIPDVYESIPTVSSFRDNIYPESVLGSFVGKADDVICISGFSAAVIEHTSGRFFPKLRERLHLVHNGIDFKEFRPGDPGPLAEELDVDLGEDIVLLHPHRPEPGKGLPETIQLVNKLVHHHKMTNIKVLVPEWIGSMVSLIDSNFYHEMTQLMLDLAVGEYFQFIPWMPIERMPALYSLGDVTLCLGNFVETFGNVAYESLACGTPSIVARVGVHRTLLPDDLIDKVDYDDIQGAATRVLAILGGKAAPEADVIAYLKEKFDIKEQLNAYGEIILNCEKREKLLFLAPALKMDQAYALAPWCYFKEDLIYHDFHGGFEHAGRLADLLQKLGFISLEEAIDAGITTNEWESWVEKTWIEPVVN